MTPDVLARVGEALFSTNPEGTGLGLATARRIAVTTVERSRLRVKPARRRRSRSSFRVETCFLTTAASPIDYRWGLDNSTSKSDVPVVYRWER
jgi:hypothetical protein